MPFFAFPLALAAAAALPTLAAIYWLHNRFQRRTVSTLIFWIDQAPARAGGLRWQRIHTPLLFFLELFALAMLVLAAMGPRVIVPERTPPLMVVLDDSFSMLAGREDSAQKRAVRALSAELNNDANRGATLILAGVRPQSLGRVGDREAHLDVMLEQWTCHSPSADIPRAIALAGEMTAGKCRVLVVSDHAPESELAQGRVRWRAFGTAEDNVGFVNAARARTDSGERCLFEIANYATRPARRELSIASKFPDGQRKSLSQTIKLQAHEVSRIVVSVPEGCDLATATLSNDALELDNTVQLLAPPSTRVAVTSTVGDPALAHLLTKALAAIPDAVPPAVGQPAQLMFADTPPSSPGASTWHVQIIREENAQSFVGPFLLDYDHPVTKGLSLDSIVWGAGASEKSTGAPVITAGNLPLITDEARLNGRHDLRVRFTPESSTLQSTPNWPILLCNLIQWRASEAPGLRETNLRVGGSTTLWVENAATQAIVRTPGGTTLTLPASDRRVSIVADRAGIYDVDAGPLKAKLSANLFSPAESDLQAACTGEWGTWNNDASIWWEHRSVAWALAITAAVALLAHAWLVARAGRSGA